MSTIRTYSELIRLPTFQERYEYLKLRGVVGFPTFGSERYVNQNFYTSSEWRRARREVIARDYGNDLGVEGFPIHDKVIVHHMNPMVPGDILDSDEAILNPEYLILVSHNTHNAIHYGDDSQLPRDYIPRRRGDTRLW